MLDALLNATGLDLIFVLCAAIGASLFAIRLLLLIFGGFADMVHIDVGDVGDLDHHDGGMQFLSLHGISAFLLMFGIVGLAMRWDGWSAFASTVGGFLAGMLAVAVSAKLFQLALRLQSSGNIGTDETVGEQGTVYLRIPAEGRGKVQVTVRGHLREYEAFSEGKEEIATGSPIQVVGSVGGDVLVVKRLQSAKAADTFGE